MANRPHILVLLGRTGNGKSTVANFLLNNKEKYETFKQGALTGAGSQSSTTEAVQIETFDYGDEKFKIVDTIGIMDTRVDTEEGLMRLMRQIAEHGASGVHVFLLCVKVGHPVTLDEEQHFRRLQNVLGSEYGTHTILVFTQAGDRDSYEPDHENRIMADRLREMGNRSTHSEANGTEAGSAQDNRKKSRERVMGAVLNLIREKDGTPYPPEKLTEAKKQLEELRDLQSSVTNLTLISRGRVVIDDYFHGKKNFEEAHQAFTELLDRQVLINDHSNLALVGQENDRLKARIGCVIRGAVGGFVGGGVTGAVIEAAVASPFFLGAVAVAPPILFALSGAALAAMVGASMHRCEAARQPRN